MEFSKYKTLSTIAKKIVDYDHVGYTSKLFMHVGAMFHPDFHKALDIGRMVSAHHSCVIGTHLTMVNSQGEKGCHAVSLWFNKQSSTSCGSCGSSGFLFDSNGKCTADHEWHIHMYYDHDMLCDIYKLDTSHKAGVQTMCPETPGYIHGGGYCVFYNLWLIDTFFKDKHKNVEYIPRILASALLDVDIAKYSKDILERVFLP